MVGINLSKKISQWLRKNEIAEKLYTEDNLLDMILAFFFETHVLKFSMQAFDMIVKAWIEGETYFDICNNAGLNRKIKEIESVCSKTISYDLTFFVGNIIDMLETDADNTDTASPYYTLCGLQKKLKYGVPTVTAISICENVFNDRYLSNLITSILGNEAITAKEVLPAFRNSKESIYDCLKPFPTYFSNKLDFLL